jgi:hypothetical protein
MSDRAKKSGAQYVAEGIGSAIIGSAIAFACLTRAVKADEGGVRSWLPGELLAPSRCRSMRRTAPYSSAAAQATAF